MLQVGFKGLDGNFIGPGFLLSHHIAGEGGLHQATKGVFDQGLVELAAPPLRTF